MTTTPTEQKPVTVGSRVRNGATVLAVREYGPNDPGAYVLLCLSRDEFVTWVSDAFGNDTFWGHYKGQDLRAALEDFDTRGR